MKAQSQLVATVAKTSHGRDLLHVTLPSKHLSHLSTRVPDLAFESF